MSETASLYSLFISSFFAATLLPGGSEAVLFGVLKAYPETLWIALGIATVGNTLGGMVTSSAWAGCCHSGRVAARLPATHRRCQFRPTEGWRRIAYLWCTPCGCKPSNQARRKSAPLWHTCTAVHMGSADW